MRNEMLEFFAYDQQKPKKYPTLLQMLEFVTYNNKLLVQGTLLSPPTFLLMLLAVSWRKSFCCAQNLGSDDT